MNLGNIFGSFGGSGTDGGIFGKNSKTLLIILVVIVVIFGFGYGRGLFGTGGANTANTYGYGYGAGYGPENYGGFDEYGFTDPRGKRKGKKHKHHRNNYDDYDGAAAYGYGYSYGTQAPGYGGYGTFPGYAAPKGGLFGNDWFFIIAVIALLFLLGEDKENTENANTNNLGL